MKSLQAVLLGVILLLALTGLEAQTVPEWRWAVNAGGISHEQCGSIAVDGQGNQYVTGGFSGSASFGSTTLTATGSSDIFVCKLDPAGNFLWARQAGGTDSESGHGIAIDNAGNCFVTGSFYGTADFGNTTLVSGGYSDAFVFKLDGAGNFLWAKQVTGTSHNTGRSISVDSIGNSFVTGGFMASASFGPITLNSTGSMDVFICKLGPDGNFLWASSAGGTTGDIGYSIAVDNAGNSFVTGWFSGSASFGSTTLSDGGSSYFFICKLNPTGNFLWARQAEGSSSSITVDGAGNSHVTGRFTGIANFGGITLVGSGHIDAFFCKLDGDGNFLWARRAGGTTYNWGEVVGAAIAVDSEGNCYVTGSFDLTAAFGATGLASSGVEDIFVCKLDANGNFLWAKQAGGAGYDWGTAIAVDDFGNSYAAGRFEGSASFGATDLTSSGGYDAFIAKLGSGTPVDDPAIPELAGNSRLYPAWPNPCRRGRPASIKAVVAERETATLSVYNLRGELILRRELASGEHEIRLDSSELTPGVYLCRLATPSGVVVRKLAIIR